ncbi:MAG: WD40 repeat domain-containing protein, partial [Chlorobiaceae bacterium]|nr:WD40 repeat domain-containing protein [Chlorobiaceae bacterium]
MGFLSKIFGKKEVELKLPKVIEDVNLVKTMEGHLDRVLGVKFSADGKKLVSGSFDETVMLWDVESGQSLLTMKGHDTWVECIDFSRDGKLLASGSTDSTVRIWDAATGQCLHVCKGHDTAVR